MAVANNHFTTDQTSSFWVCGSSEMTQSDDGDFRFGFKKRLRLSGSIVCEEELLQSERFTGEATKVVLESLAVYEAAARLCSSPN